MGFFSAIRDRLFPSSPSAGPHEPTPSSAWTPLIGFRENAGETAAGSAMSTDAALRVAAVFACVRVLAESVAQLPVHIHEDTGDGESQRIFQSPLLDLLKQPNPWQTSYEFLECMTGVCALRGNAYAYRQGNGATPSALIPLNPDRMKVEQIAHNAEANAFRLVYEYNWGDGTQGRYTQDQILHLRGFSTDGVMGLSTVRLACDAVQIARGAEQLNKTQFGHRPMMAGVLQHPGKLSSDEAGKRLSKSFREAYSGQGGWHGVALLEEGMTWTSIGMTNADAEFLQTRQFQVTDIARWFRVPPHMIGDLSRATFSNIEQMSIEFVVYTLMPWLSRWETMLGRALVPEGQFVKIVPDALLRGTTDARFKAYGMGIKDGWMTRNEARRLEDLPPIEGLDEPLRPLNMAEESEAEGEDGDDEETDEAPEEDPMPEEDDDGQD